MREKNATKLKELEDKIQDAETNMGEQEVGHHVVLTTGSHMGG